MVMLGIIYRWRENYLKNQKQLIFLHSSTKKAAVICGVPQGSNLGPLLFLLYLYASKVLNPVMTADDTNLSFSHSNINILFEKMNGELANNIRKLCHKNWQKHNQHCYFSN